jgi:hypothetical protein
MRAWKDEGGVVMNKNTSSDMMPGYLSLGGLARFPSKKLVCQRRQLGGPLQPAGAAGKPHGDTAFRAVETYHPATALHPGFEDSRPVSVVFIDNIIQQRVQALAKALPLPAPPQRHFQAYLEGHCRFSRSSLCLTRRPQPGRRLLHVLATDPAREPTPTLLPDAAAGPGPETGHQPGKATRPVRAGEHSIDQFHWPGIAGQPRPREHSVGHPQSFLPARTAASHQSQAAPRPHRYHRHDRADQPNRSVHATRLSISQYFFGNLKWLIKIYLFAIE